MYQPMYGQGYPGGYLAGYPTAYGPLQYYPPLAAAAAYYPTAMQPAPVRPTIMVSVSFHKFNLLSCLSLKFSTSLMDASMTANCYFHKKLIRKSNLKFILKAEWI